MFHLQLLKIALIQTSADKTLFVTRTTVTTPVYVTMDLKPRMTHTVKVNLETAKKNDKPYITSFHPKPFLAKGQWVPTAIIQLKMYFSQNGNDSCGKEIL